MKFTPGEVVEVTGNSKKSYWLYRAFQARVPYLTCACQWKRGTLAIVDSSYDNGSVIIKERGNPSKVGIAYYGDLTPYYEVED